MDIQVLKIFEGILGGIIANDWYLIDPTTGKPTTWGFWGPKELNDNPERVSERGLGSLQILAWLTAAYSITGNATYHDLFWSLVNDHQYDKNTGNVKIDSTTDENHRCV